MLSRKTERRPLLLPCWLPVSISAKRRFFSPVKVGFGMSLKAQDPHSSAILCRYPFLLAVEDGPALSRHFDCLGSFCGCRKKFCTESTRSLTSNPDCPPDLAVQETMPRPSLRAAVESGFYDGGRDPSFSGAEKCRGQCSRFQLDARLISDFAASKAQLFDVGVLFAGTGPHCSALPDGRVSNA